MFSTFDVVTTGAAICLIAVGVYAVQLQTFGTERSQSATVAGAAGLQVVTNDSGQSPVEDSAPLINTNQYPTMITDIKAGAGATAHTGDTVAVHYVGQLQDGTEFDNSHKRGAPIEFTLGAGMVIAGWDEGIVGMQVGGERKLVIPPEKAYGAAGIPGVIPPHATLVFTTELVEIK